MKSQFNFAERDSKRKNVEKPLALKYGIEHANQISEQWRGTSVDGVIRTL